MSPDLLNKLHEGASVQYGHLWLAINGMFVDVATDVNVSLTRAETRELLTRICYTACQLIEDKKPNLDFDLRFLDLYRDSTLEYLKHESTENDAVICARKAAHHARLILEL